MYVLLLNRVVARAMLERQIAATAGAEELPDPDEEADRFRTRIDEPLDSDRRRETLRRMAG